MDDGPVAAGVSAKLGEPLPTATPQQLDTFVRGKAVFQRRFDLVDGLGPAFNVTFCGGCHERPVPGGSAGLYRNFLLAGQVAPDGTFVFSDSAGVAGGVVRAFNYGSGEEFRPAIPTDTTILAQRNAIPFFGVALFAEVSDEEIISRSDPTDVDGDGISGRPNIFDRTLGRFGRKAQTASLEAFIRGPLFNHMGITTAALTDAQRAALPAIPGAASPATMRAITEATTVAKAGPHMQVSIPTGPDGIDPASVDDDVAADPEMNAEDLFDLISYVMLLAAPELEAPTTQSNRGRLLFHDAGCATCHVPRLASPRGPIAAYSDLLLHDMGEALADGIVQGIATGSEFRTQPLWGLSAVGPYLHDGRAETIEDAILAHGGESRNARDAFAVFDENQRGDLVEFLLSLGGRNQTSPGLVEPGTPIADVGAYGGPLRPLTSEEQDRFLSGRDVFDRDFGHASGIGALTGADGGPRFNGDSCRACHFDPIIGGAGPRGVNVMRHGIVLTDGSFSAPSDTPNTILHKHVRVGFDPPEPTTEINVFEHRQTPHVFGMGLIDAVSDETIVANADPNDVDGDGISGRAHMLDDGRIGRLGWKAQVPSIAEFVRDAMAAEMGITLPRQDGLSFGLSEDDDGVADPELPLQQTEDLVFFLATMAGPPRQPVSDSDAAVVAAGEDVFEQVGCSKCHMPSLPSSLGDVPLYSDLLLHDILPAGTPGIVDGAAAQTEFRTAPLWGLSQTAPYGHAGDADTIDAVIRRHAGEAETIRDAYVNLSTDDRTALLAFLESL